MINLLKIIFKSFNDDGQDAIVPIIQQCDILLTITSNLSEKTLITAYIKLEN